MKRTRWAGAGLGLILTALLFAGCGSGSDSSSAPMQTAAQGRIVFVSDRDGNKEIYMMNADGTDQRRMTQNSAVDDTPVLSPDGQKIAFVSDRNGVRQVFVMDADGRMQTQVTNSAYDCADPAFYPNSQMVIFVTRPTADALPTAYVVDIYGDGLRPVSPSGMYQVHPVFVPVRDKIAFASYANQAAGSGRYSQPELALYTVNLDGSGLEQISNTIFGDRPSLVSSADGTRLAFSSAGGMSVGYATSIYQLTGGSTASANLTGDLLWSDQPSFSPDGQYIAFAHAENWKKDIYVMAADGTGCRKLADSPGNNEHPSWGAISQ